MNTATERRRFHRVAFHATTELQLDNHCWSCELLDVSLKGLLVAMPKDSEVPAEGVTEARIRLSDDAVICMRIALARRNREQLGFVCNSIDLDSVCHLRRLVELNLGDPQASERDLSQLARFATSQV